MNEDIGNILKQKRTDLGLEIAEISKRTRMNSEFILAIEENDKERIPESYYKLFVKKYADLLDVEIPETEKEEEESDHIYEMLSRKDENIKIRDRFSSVIRKLLLFGYVHRKIFLSLILIFMVFLFVKHIYSILNTGPKTEKSESMVKIITIDGEADERISVDIRDSIIIEEDKPDYFSLKILASDSCYICYFYDTLKVKETILLPGKLLDVKAERNFEAKLGKSNAVYIEYNQKRVLDELKQFKNASSFIKATHFGTERIRRSDKINEYLKETYGLE
ncbi:MAG: helix-turn-helix domain-containing protein [Candidatus Delongbacteria bacterium]